MLIKPMLPAHANAVLEIYAEGLRTGNASFQLSVPSWEEWDKSHLNSCRLVAIDNDQVTGWAALTAVSGRCVYAGVAEISVYVAEKARGKGVGKPLLMALIDESELNNIWTLQAGIFPENTPSIQLHESCGFRLVGRREKIGQMNGTWRDTLLLERRSIKTGL